MPGDPDLPVADLNHIPAAAGRPRRSGDRRRLGRLRLRRRRRRRQLHHEEGLRRRSPGRPVLLRPAPQRQRADARRLPQARGSRPLRQRTRPNIWSTPADNITDGETFDITGIIGVNSPDGKGNVTAYAGYRNLKAALQDDRDYAACSVGTDIGHVAFTGVAANWRCAGSSNSAYGSFNPQQGRRFNLETVLSNGDWARTTGPPKPSTASPAVRLPSTSTRPTTCSAPTSATSWAPSATMKWRRGPTSTPR